MWASHSYICWTLMSNVNTSPSVVCCFPLAKPSFVPHAEVIKVAIQVENSLHRQFGRIHISGGQHYPWWIIHWQLLLKRVLALMGCEGYFWLNPQWLCKEMNALVLLEIAVPYFPFQLPQSSVQERRRTKGNIQRRVGITYCILPKGNSLDITQHVQIIVTFPHVHPSASFFVIFNDSIKVTLISSSPNLKNVFSSSCFLNPY